MESDAEFVDGVKRLWDDGYLPCVEDWDRLFALARRGAEMQAERRTGLRLVMVSATLLDQEDLPDEPSAILCGSIDAIRNLGGLLGDPVDVIPLPTPPSGESDD